MLNVRISPKNAAAVKQLATIEPAPNLHGYTRAITATAAGHQYKIETLNGPRPLYVLTAYEAPASLNYIIVVFQDYTAESIAIRDAQIFRNGSNYTARKESAPRYLKKYSQLAALVHGLITNGATAGPDSTAPTLAESAAERDKTPAEPEAPTKPAEPAADMNPATEHEKPHRGPAKRFSVYIYTTPEGVRRADIRTTSGRPWMDIPAAELDAIRAEIETKSPGRVSFEITEQPAGESAKPATEPAPGDSTPQKGPENVGTEPHPAPGKVCRPTNARRAYTGRHATRRHWQRYRTEPRPHIVPPRHGAPTTAHGDRAKGPTAPANRHHIHKYTRRNIAPYRATQNRTRASAREPA